MKWVYILIVLVIAASALGCVDKKQAETTTKTSVPQGETTTSDAVATSPEASSNGEDLFGTESDLSAMNTTFGDMNMEISLLDSI